MAPEITVPMPDRRYHVLGCWDDDIMDEHVYTALDLKTLEVKELRMPRRLLTQMEYC